MHTVALESGDAKEARPPMINDHAWQELVHWFGFDYRSAAEVMLEESTGPTWNLSAESN